MAIVTSLSLDDSNPDKPEAKRMASEYRRYHGTCWKHYNETKRGEPCICDIASALARIKKRREAANEQFGIRNY